MKRLASGEEKVGAVAGLPGWIEDVRITKGATVYRRKWWKRAMQRLGLWIARMSGYREPTVSWQALSAEGWIRQEGKYRHVYLQSATDSDDGAVYLDGTKFLLPN